MDGSSYWHEKGVDAVNAGAIMYSVLAITATDKKLKSGYTKASWLLSAFAKGTGPKSISFSEGDAFSGLLNADNQLIREVASDFVIRLKQEYGDYGNDLAGAVDKYFGEHSDLKIFTSSVLTMQG